MLPWDLQIQILGAGTKQALGVLYLECCESAGEFHGLWRVCLCSICEEVILDATAKKDGHAAIQCEGVCGGWLHRQCAGLSVIAFETASKSSDPFYCPQCKLGKQQLEIN